MSKFDKLTEAYLKVVNEEGSYPGDYPQAKVLLRDIPKDKLHSSEVDRNHLDRLGALMDYEGIKDRGYFIQQLHLCGILSKDEASAIYAYLGN
jgi:hypothetical protein